ncbi:unnamed protein product [Clavelina lepadiformis]|uniref:Elongator complex protein 2 n=1 Tax=Clavelina lepadiformis TaxID=159417 RepID=A0ABP0F8R9_CLALP
MDNSYSVKLKHIALCANRSVNCLDAGPLNLVAFGCSNSVALYKPIHWDSKKLCSIQSFNGHKKKVLCVKWMKEFFDTELPRKSNVLFSGSADNTLRCWIFKDNQVAPILEKEFSFLGHKDSITSIDAISTYDVHCQNKELYLVATSGADSSLRLWEAYDSLSQLECVQTMDFKHGFVLNVAFHLLPNCKVPILACACDDFKIRIYVIDTGTEKQTAHFHNVLILPGHEDWVRNVDFITLHTGEIYMATCSQDSFIRLWKIWLVNNKATEDKVQERYELKLRKQLFTINVNNTSFTFAASLDAVLIGHENWVYSVQWQLTGKSTIGVNLLSASIDKTVVIWEYDDAAGIWVDKVRVGEVGGNTLGFYGAQFSEDGKHIIAQSFSGALHGWDRRCDDQWEPAVMVSGHSSVVNDIDWEPKQGRYLLTTSEDQTTRLVAEWKEDKSWHEIARPQIHGYDMQCLSMIHSTKFISGADEKVLRVFDASSNFISNLRSLTEHDLVEMSSQAPEGATVPALGLSNKAVFSSEEKTPLSDRKEQYIENLFVPVKLIQPPPETYLLQNTLWPESRKLYGHVYEIFCLSCNHEATLVASAAKSSQAKHAGIIIWEVDTWKQVTTLSGHTLTVTQMEFSPNDNYLVTVSRDRTWNLYRITKLEGVYNVEHLAHSEKKTCHSRIIWSCSWSHDNTYFATASRDKKIMIWKVTPNEEQVVKRAIVGDCGEPVTAIAFASHKLSTYLLAIGCESGSIKLSSFTENHILVDMIHFDSQIAHCLAVKRLKWKPGVSRNDSMTLASCSQDHQVKFFEVTWESKPIEK